MTIASALASLTAWVASFLNLPHDVGLAGEARFAAARRLDGLLELLAVLEPHLDAHHVAVVRAARGDRGIVQHADLFRQRDAPLVVDHLVGELIDEHVAFEQQRRDAERQVQLRRGEALRRIGPADVLDRHLRSVHHDRRDIVRAERRLCLHHANGVERGVVAADAGIEFQRNAQRLPLPAELPRQLVEIEAVGRAREGRAKAAIGRFENVDDAGETGLRRAARRKARFAPRARHACA